MLAVLVAQFLSAFGDNALLVAAIALVKSTGSAGLEPFLQQSFVIPYVFLAPFVGAFADAIPKGRAMFISNALKFAGSACMSMGVNPLASYFMAGIGAAAYSPAKYGILPQLFPPEKLVKANALLEGSTIVAILLGVVAGGAISDRSVSGALYFVIACYAFAAAVNLLIPKLPPERNDIHVRRLLPEFIESVSCLFRHSDGRFALLGTSLFWGSGATLRIALFAWVPAALAITDNGTPANMMGVVSVGIVFGAVAASAWVRLEKVNRVLPAGILLGILISVLAMTSSESAAMVMLVMIGTCGGFYAVPLNAVLQEIGHERIGAGRALAVQNFFENIAIFSLVGIYASLQKHGFPVREAVSAFGILVFLGMLLIAVPRWRNRGA